MRRIELPPMGHILYKVPFAMALVSPEDQLVHIPMGCRDYLHDIIKAHVNGKRIGKNQFGVDSYYKPGKDAPNVCLDKLRLMISLFEDKAKFMENAMRTLNVVEQYAEIPPSMYEEVSFPMEGRHYLIEGTGEYPNNPHMLSALTFILRFVIKNHLSYPIDSAEAFIGKFDELRKRKDLHVYADMRIANSCGGRLLKVLKDRKYIFAGVTQKQLYPKEASLWYHSKGGIASLCEADTHNTVVNNRVRALT